MYIKLANDIISVLICDFLVFLFTTVLVLLNDFIHHQVIEQQEKKKTTKQLHNIHTIKRKAQTAYFHMSFLIQR